MILAGLETVYGEVGEVIAAGAPLGLMGGGEPGVTEFLVSVQDGGGARDTETLYMELRQGTEPVDPARMVRHNKESRDSHEEIRMAALGGTVAGIVLTTQVAGPLLAQEAQKSASVYEQLDLFGDIFERIRAQYVEEVDTNKLIEAAINGMLTSLDPHSSYLAAKDFDDMQVQTQGEFGGLGIEVTQEEGFVKVVSPMDDTPADAGRHRGGRFHHPCERRIRSGSDAGSGGRNDARAGWL